MSINDSKPQSPKSSERLGVPLFAKIAIIIIIGLALDTVILKPLRERHNYQTPRSVVTSGPKKVTQSIRVESRQDRAQALHIRAKYFIQQGRYKEAEREAEKSLQASNKFYRAYMDLGVVYSRYGDYLKAERAFKTALENIGNDTFDLEIIYGDLGTLYYVEKRFDEAWDYLRLAYERKTYLGDHFWSDKRFKCVKTNEKDKFIEQGRVNTGLPDEIERWRLRLRALLGKDNDAIVRDCKQYITDNPGSVYTYVFRSLLASALLRTGETDLALQQLMIVESENFPDYYIPWLKYTYAYLYNEKGDKQKAIEYLKDVIANYPAYKSIDKVRALLARLEA